MNFRTNSFTFSSSLILTGKSYLRQAASRYQLHLPTEAELRRELVRVASPLENQLQLNLNRD